MADRRGRGNRGGRGGRSEGRGRGSHRGRDLHQSVQDSDAVNHSQQEYNAHLSERFRGGGRGYRNFFEERVQQAEMNGLKLKLNPKIRQYVEQQDMIQEDKDAAEWLRMSEIATTEEIALADSFHIKLPANRLEKPYKNAARYLKTHYELLREDATGSLRDAVDSFKRNPDKGDDSKSNVYEKVHISGFTFTGNGAAARIQFSTRRATRRIAWRSSKRLVSGNIVALSPVNDNFMSRCIIAIVAARPIDLLERKPPEVDIYFSRPEDAEFDPQQEFIMLEATDGYYEAYRHTLRALQKMSGESFALADSLLGQVTDIGPPAYLSLRPNRDLSAAAKEDLASDMSSVDVIENWPDSSDHTTLDATQWDALRQILTKKIAIVQGPPGTGKTHVSKIALQVMIENRLPTDPPIIVAAQTNHALDQLLEHVSDFENNFVRLGGRSTSLAIKKHALYDIRTTERIPNIPGSSLGKARRDLDHASIAFANIMALFSDSSEPISAETFLRLHIITEKQCHSLQDAAKNWVTTGSVEVSAMQHWLHKALVPFEIPVEEEIWGFQELEEDELEFEEINEIDAEHGVDDEEDIEQLRGPWKAVRDRWTVPEPSEIDLERAKKLLDTRQDLWSVPDGLRGPMYLVMRRRAGSLARSHFRDALRDYNMVVRELKIGKWEKDVIYLQRANIIGMTTTGLSKYRPLISSLEPKIVLIEEAAEVIEGPIMAACFESLEHLILVGDHMQLRGHCTVDELGRAPYNLSVSMFERLVKFNLPFKRLLRQRRMRPEFRRLISPLYDGLGDHPHVLERPEPQPWGMGNVHSYFFSHEWSEMKDSHMSTYNEEEARMVVKFYRHLLRNGLPPAGATILTFYNGQKRRVLRELRNDPETAASINIVKTVDSYQGEENEVVILSLVRNNTEGQIGFLEIENRVCVAMSRAKFGFYLFGNAEVLSGKSSLWYHVRNTLAAARRIGHKLPITCQSHGRTIHMQYPEDFDANSGGCEQACGATLDCGHPCPDRCHSYPHDTVRCRYACGTPVEEEEPELVPQFARTSLLQNDGVGHLTHTLVEQNAAASRTTQDDSSRVLTRLHYAPMLARGLARGGGAFQRQVDIRAENLVCPQTDAHPSGPTRTTPVLHPDIPQEADSGPGFAGDDNQAAGNLADTASMTSSNYQDKGIQADLLGLPLWPATGPSVTVQSQRDIGGGRTRYVDIWHPSPAAVTGRQHETQQEEVERDTTELPPIIGGGYARGVEEWAWRPNEDADAGRVDASWDRRSPSIDGQW